MSDKEQTLLRIGDESAVIKRRKQFTIINFIILLIYYFDIYFNFYIEWILQPFSNKQQMHLKEFKKYVFFFLIKTK